MDTEAMRNAAHWLTTHVSLSLLASTMQDHLPLDCTAYSGPSILTINQETLQTCLQVNSLSILSSQL